MSELGEGQSVVEITDTKTNVAHRIRRAYTDIIDGLDKGELIKPIESVYGGTDAYETLPLEGDNLPFPLNKKNASVDLTCTKPEGHPNDAIISWEEDDNTYRIIELRKGEEPMYTYEIGHIDKQGNRVQRNVLVCEGGSIRVHMLSPRVDDKESAIESLNVNALDNRYVRARWREAKKELNLAVQGIQSLKPLG